MTAPSASNRRQVLAPGTVITATGQTGTLTLASDAVPVLNLYATITAASGTSPSITFGIAFDSDPGGATWPVGGFAAATTGAAQTAVGTDVLVATATHPVLTSGDTSFYRVVYTVTGTSPSFTLSLYTDN
jgi:hypothetical protein